MNYADDTKIHTLSRSPEAVENDINSANTQQTLIRFQSFEASNRGQISCQCTLDQWLDLIGVISN